MSGTLSEQATSTPAIVTLSPAHYIYVQRSGDSIPSAAQQSWHAASAIIPTIQKNHHVISQAGVYKIRPVTYCAGVIVQDAPELADGSTPVLPSGCDYMIVPGGRYVKHVSPGSYENLPAAYQRTYEYIKEHQMTVRDDAYHMETYGADTSLIFIPVQ